VTDARGPEASFIQAHASFREAVLSQSPVAIRIIAPGDRPELGAAK
jgi:hypothetical protein